MTEEELRQYTRTELDKRINSVIEWVANIIDLEHVPGVENKKIRFGDTIKIKDEMFNPPLYVEARVHQQERDIKKRSRKRVKLGDFEEFTEEEVNAVWQRLQAIIQEKISMSEFEELTYTKPEIEERDKPGNDAADKIETDVGWTEVIETEQGSQDKADQAEQNANDHTDQVKENIDQELLDKAGLEYVDGQLALKADSDLVNSINDTVDGLEQSVSDHADELEAQGGRIVIVEADLDEVEGDLSLVITDLSTLDNTVQQHGTEISANTSAIELKASQNALEDLEDDVTLISNDVSNLTVDVDGISGTVSSLEAEVDSHSTDISDLNAELNIQAGEIGSKVDATYVTGAIADIEVGGRNYFSTVLYVKLESDKNNYDIDENGHLIILDTDGTGDDHSNYDYFVKVEPNTNYVLSFSEPMNERFYGYDEDQDVVNLSITSSSDDRVFYIETTSESVEMGMKFFPINTDYPVVTSVKLEKGNKATDWSPAPEDVQSEIDSVYSYAESEFNQVAGRIDLKADAEYVDDVETRVTSAEANIDGLEGEKQLKVSESYVDERIYRYPNNAYAPGDNAGGYSPKPSVAVMQTTQNSWPGSAYGTLTTYWSTDERASQRYVDSNGDVWEREVHPSSNPNWSSWRQIEDVDGAQSKVNNAVDPLDSRVTTAESEITQHANQIELKVEENDVRSIFTFEADQINFDGHVFGGDATFAGDIEGGSIKSNTSIDVNTDLKVGDNIYLGDQGSSDVKRIYFNNSANISADDVAFSLEAGRVSLDISTDITFTTGNIDYYFSTGGLTVGGFLYTNDEIMVQNGAGDVVASRLDMSQSGLTAGYLGVDTRLRITDGNFWQGSSSATNYQEVTASEFTTKFVN